MALALAVASWSASASADVMIDFQPVPALTPVSGMATNGTLNVLITPGAGTGEQDMSAVTVRIAYPAADFDFLEGTLTNPFGFVLAAAVAQAGPIEQMDFVNFSAIAIPPGTSTLFSIGFQIAADATTSEFPLSFVTTGGAGVDSDPTAFGAPTIVVTPEPAGAALILAGAALILGPRPRRRGAATPTEC